MEGYFASCVARFPDVGVVFMCSSPPRSAAGKVASRSQWGENFASFFYKNSGGESSGRPASVHDENAGPTKGAGKSNALTLYKQCVQ